MLIPESPLDAHASHVHAAYHIMPVKRDYSDRLLGQLEPLLCDIVSRLRDAFSPQTIYLHGSYAHGQPHGDSDIDLLVVVADSPLDPYTRDALAYRALRDIPVPIDVQVYTQQEFDERAALKVSFERTVKQKGRLIHAA